MKKKIAYILVLTIFGISSGFFTISQTIASATQVKTVNVIEEEVKVEFISKTSKRVYAEKDGFDEISHKTKPVKQFISLNINIFFNYAAIPLYLLYESLLI